MCEEETAQCVTVIMLHWLYMRRMSVAHGLAMKSAWSSGTLCCYWDVSVSGGVALALKAAGESAAQHAQATVTFPVCLN